MSGNATTDNPLLQRTLSVVYRFYDAFFFPITDGTPAIDTPLDVTIPALEWTAQRIEKDLSYRFSALTLTRPAPVGANLDVDIAARDGRYLSWEPVQVTLPRPASAPPVAADFLIAAPLWPTTTLRPPIGETAVIGRITSPTAQVVAGLKVQLWTGGSATPPAGTPYTRTNKAGEFLFRFPLLKGAARSIVSTKVWLDNNAVPASPSALSVVLGQSQIIGLQRN